MKSNFQNLKYLITADRSNTHLSAFPFALLSLWTFRLIGAFSGDCRLRFWVGIWIWSCGQQIGLLERLAQYDITEERLFSIYALQLWYFPGTFFSPSYYVLNLWDWAGIRSARLNVVCKGKLSSSFWRFWLISCCRTSIFISVFALSSFSFHVNSSFMNEMTKNQLFWQSPPTKLGFYRCKSSIWGYSGSAWNYIPSAGCLC